MCLMLWISRQGPAAPFSPGSVPCLVTLEGVGSRFTTMLPKHSKEQLRVGAAPTDPESSFLSTFFHKSGSPSL